MAALLAAIHDVQVPHAKSWLAGLRRP